MNPRGRRDKQGDIIYNTSVARVRYRKKQSLILGGAFLGGGPPLEAS